MSRLQALCNAVVRFRGGRRHVAARLSTELLTGLRVPQTLLAVPKRASVQFLVRREIGIWRETRSRPSEAPRDPRPGEQAGPHPFLTRRLYVQAGQSVRDDPDRLDADEPVFLRPGAERARRPVGPGTGHLPDRPGIPRRARGGRAPRPRPHRHGLRRRRAPLGRGAPELHAGRQRYGRVRPGGDDRRAGGRRRGRPHGSPDGVPGRSHSAPRRRIRRGRPPRRRRPEPLVLPGHRRGSGVRREDLGGDLRRERGAASIRPSCRTITAITP